MRATLPRIDRSLIRQPDPGLGNPTLLLFLAGIIISSASTVAGMAGQVPLIVSGIINGVCLYAFYTVTHEAVHRTAHPNPAVNEWFGRIAAALEGMTFPIFRIIHLQHHAFTNHPDRDPDYVIGRKPRWLLPVWTLIRLTHDNAFMVQQRLWSRRRADLLEHVFTVGLQVATVTALTVMGYGKAVLILWLVPAAMAGAALDLAVAWAVHYPHESQHPLENTRMFRGLVWQILTFSQNYHLVHHLWTTIPWFRYRAAADLAAKALAEHRLTIPAHAQEVARSDPEATAARS
jgi:beta-carotene hydroxylase